METLKIQEFICGHCFFPDFLFQRGGKWSWRIFPARAWLIQHPTKGNLLFDTGYSGQFLTATTFFPERLYRLTTPVCFTQQQSLASQLNNKGIPPESISRAFLSHLHADHTAGLRDFPNARFSLLEAAFQSFEHLKDRRFKGIRSGFLSSLFPDDFKERAVLLQLNQTFKGQPSCDFFGDGTITVVDLPGHAPGHGGLLLNTSPRQFLVGDACWSQSELDGKIRLHPLAKSIIYSSHDYQRTQQWLKSLPTDINILPCHESWPQ